jgi:ribosomal protein L30/L7E
MVMRLPKKKSKTIKPMVGIPGAINKMIKSLGLTAAQQLKLKKQMKQAGGISGSDALKAAAAKIKSQKTQSKGPVGTRLKKRSILGK